MLFCTVLYKLGKVIGYLELAYGCVTIKRRWVVEGGGARPQAEAGGVSA